jgi:4-amino-4-deoxy-L-arabinose transferase-like glycosyltransferase
MKTEAGRSWWWTLVLILAGVTALTLGTKGLMIIAIVATAFWFSILEPTNRGNQN